MSKKASQYVASYNIFSCSMDNILQLLRELSVIISMVLSFHLIPRAQNFRFGPLVLVFLNANFLSTCN